MKGKLLKTKDFGWIVEGKEEFLYLHPDDVYEILEQEKVFDNIEARIAAHPDVEYEIVENQKMSGVVKYAKLKN